VSYVHISRAKSSPAQKYVNSSSKNSLFNKPKHPRLDSVLSKLVDIFRNDGRNAAEKFAQARNLKLSKDKILVELTLLPAHSTADIPRAILDRCSANICSISRHFILVQVPIDCLTELAREVKGLSLIHRPYPIFADVVSEGVDLIGVPIFHQGHVKGEGARLAIIDTGFRDWEDVAIRNELPVFPTIRNFTDEDIESGGQHGTAVGEILYDCAPDAEYYIIKIDDDADFENAVQYAIDEEIEIICMSLSWFIPFGDYYRGDDLFSQIVNDAFNQGVLFVKSAGNYATQHYRARFDADDDDNRHRFEDDNQVNHFGLDEGDFIEFRRNDEIVVSLVWDDFPQTDQDYDLELVYLTDDEWEIVEISNNRQDGEQPPSEFIEYLVEESGRYGVRVLRFDGEEEMDFTIFANRDLAYHHPEGSIGVPGMAENIMAVAAINYIDWNEDDVEQEFYSSQGPTYDGRLKPVSVRLSTIFHLIALLSS